MSHTRIIAISIFLAIVMGPASQAQDLSRYREFQFEMSLAMVAKQAHLKPTEAVELHHRPAVIQELAWQSLNYTHESLRSESVKDITFSFYNGKLARIVVIYDRERTEGMTIEDMIEAISEKYGTPSKPAAEITLFSTYILSDGEKTYSNQSEKVIARWEDSEHSFNLYQSSIQSTFGLVAFSKRLDAQVKAASVEAIRLDQQEAPQREIQNQKKKGDENRVRQQKARRANKSPFRP